MGGTLYIVGAGPGDPDLITVKGARILCHADVVLYDALVSKELLKETKPHCKLIFVGKRKGSKEFSQEEINQLLVFYVSRFQCVVRLKGGDPYVFGRGHEELTYANRRGVNVKIIPGISSATAAPASAGIPLTKRGVNESFWVVTGTLSSGQMANDVRLAAKSSATVVILMGINHINEIAAIFADERNAMEPIAIIENATMPSQRIIRGVASDIFERAQLDQVNTPAVIVAGQVVDEMELFEMVQETNAAAQW